MGPSGATCISTITWNGVSFSSRSCLSLVLTVLRSRVPFRSPVVCFLCSSLLHDEQLTSIVLNMAFGGVPGGGSLAPAHRLFSGLAVLKYLGPLVIRYVSFGRRPLPPVDTLPLSTASILWFSWIQCFIRGGK